MSDSSVTHTLCVPISECSHAASTSSRSLSLWQEVYEHVPAPSVRPRQPEPDRAALRSTGRHFPSCGRVFVRAIDAWRCCVHVWQSRLPGLTTAHSLFLFLSLPQLLPLSSFSSLCSLDTISQMLMCRHRHDLWNCRSRRQLSRSARVSTTRSH